MYNPGDATLFPSGNFTNSSSDCVGGLFNQGAPYRVLAIVTGSLSLVGTTFIISSFIAFKHLRASLGFRLIFYLSVSNLISAIQVVMQSANEHCTNGACTFGAWLSQFGNLSGIFWVAFIGLNFFLAISGVNHKASASKFNKHKEKIFHGISWGLPGLFTIIAGSVPGMFGVSGMWCWITGEFIAARIVMYDIWIMLIYIWSAFLLVWVCMKRRIMQDIPTVARRLIYYIIVFFICNLFTIFGTFSFYLNRNDSDWIRIAIALFEPLHGFLNALVYGLNIKVCWLLRVHGRHAGRGEHSSSCPCLMSCCVCVFFSFF
jgi:hypothetical protein